MMIYRIRNLLRVHGRRTVLDIPRLDIQAKKIHALLGPNGAGKTTLLQILGFLDSPDAGTVEFRSVPVDFSGSSLAGYRREVVLVDQQPIMFSTSVWKNVEYPLKIRKIPARQRPRIIEESLELVGMERFAQAAAHRLSGGETQRVAIARGLAASPAVFLCDEPTASVDVENQAAILNILRRINREKGISVIFTTHDRLQAGVLADRVLHLDHGSLGDAPLENVFSARLERIDALRSRALICDEVGIDVPFASGGNQAGRCRLYLDPREISLNRPPAGGVAATRIRGRVVQLTAANDHVRVVVDVGVWITVYMEREDYETRKPAIGEAVSLGLGSEAVHLLE